MCGFVVSDGSRINAGVSSGMRANQVWNVDVVIFPQTVHSNATFAALEHMHDCTQVIIALCTGESVEWIMC